MSLCIPFFSCIRNSSQQETPSPAPRVLSSEVIQPRSVAVPKLTAEETRRSSDAARNRVPLVPVQAVEIPVKPAAPTIPALFKAENLKFGTKEEGSRPATLYFRSNENSGRIRQQHWDGAMSKMDKNKRLDYFFESRDKFEQFGIAHARHYGSRDSLPTPAEYGAITEPTAGFYHVELEDTAYEQLFHGSTGKTFLDTSNFDDSTIQEIFESIKTRI